MVLVFEICYEILKRIRFSGYVLDLGQTSRALGKKSPKELSRVSEISSNSAATKSSLPNQAVFTLMLKENFHVHQY